ncbi:RNA polymerase, sigma 28 subunit, SigD/FliA/WhiG [Sulfurivirga caldicuralii]|uniref:RNA polymerase sigma factor FliA n=1 Tax=Sulfurivirga caldicuralii TaxID=364032 RepID=A0A1N6FKR9_9GAMM|nr:RNA polymerase sigma factor FliA [Sulfurivirga caldicuralii]SIN95826.1 RNA polymerase, sigma 28 subunit, SigD/FliA/WhiG [Sulfurivirga caldicuralii]
MKGASAYEKVARSSSPELGDVESYLPLVKRIAWHLKGRLPESVLVDDLIQAGVLGLIEAMQNFRNDQGATFETYAGIRIRGAMLDEIRRGDWTPRSVHKKAREVSEAIAVVEAREGREARDEEVAEVLGLTLTEYHKILQDTNSAQLLSIDEPDHDELNEDQLVSHGPTPLREVMDDAFQNALAEEIGRLPEKEKLVMALYYDEELNLKEIGEVLGVSESRVSQLHSQAIKRLRARLKNWI